MYANDLASRDDSQGFSIYKKLSPDSRRKTATTQTQNKTRQNAYPDLHRLHIEAMTGKLTLALWD